LAFGESFFKEEIRDQWQKMVTNWN
jgi:hypothetical protein